MMNRVWAVGRICSLGLLILVLFSAAGYVRPLSVLKIIAESQTDDSEQESAGTESDTSTDEISAASLVQDWEQPLFAFFVTGRQHGYIEPCGCTGLENQKGGLMRRHDCMETFLSQNWDLIPIDAGNQVRRFGQQPNIKLDRTYESLCRVMKYDVIGLGPDDLRIPPIDLCTAFVNAQQEQNPFVCANVEVIDASLTERFKVIEKGGKRIGVTMVLGDEHLEKFRQASDLKVVSVADGLTQVVPQIQTEKCDYHVLIAFTEPEKCRDLAKQFPIFDLLVTAGGAGDPTLHPEEIKIPGGITSMIQVGVKGMYVGMVGIYEVDGQLSLKYQRLPLDDHYSDSEKIKKVFLNYQNDLKRLWEAGSLADIKPQSHPRGHAFVGSDACADCHDAEFEIWKDGVDGDGGPHENATRSLTDPNQRSWVQRHFDPECVSCHMTGWNPQEYYPYKTGYLDLDKDHLLHANGCENCHGPGSAHIDAEKNHEDNQTLLDQLRGEMRLTLEEARKTACMQCHDLDNSPDFLKEGGFDEYWPHIEH